MPTENENFFTRERLQAIGMGIGRGFQAYDPNNPFAGAGAAMEATIGTEMAFDAQRRQRSERLEDLAEIERKQLRAEERAEKSQLESERRAEEGRERAADRQMKRTLELQQKQREAERDWYASMDVVGIDRGLNTRDRNKKAATNKAFSEWFAGAMGGGAPRFSGKAPINPYEETVPEFESRGIRRGSGYSMPQDKPQSRARGMMRTQDGRMVKAIEDKDQDTPLFGEGGRDYAY
jgi:hypothetical protein